ncbi:uncharacterized protein LOC131948298, partial [Physella acuta]|uniref:uncharacterized protein LOC131948298 n=1 Tax=Physella acuta TaxID=109671 RepID=UPI0027DE1A0D
MPRRKTTLSDVLPPAPNQAEETSSDSAKTNERPSKRRKTSVGSVTDNGSGASSGSMDLDKKTRQTRSSSNVQPTSKKASILSRAATSTSPAPPPLLPPTPATSTAVVTEAILSHLGQATLPGATTLTIAEQPVEQNVINVGLSFFVLLDFFVCD